MTATSILLVEDDPAALLLIERALRTLGYHVVVATGSQTALERIAEFQPDGMILDIHLPGMEGTELLYFLRRHKQHTPAIAITGDQEITDEEVKASGFLALVRKPFTLDELRDAVVTHIG